MKTSLLSFAILGFLTTASAPSAKAELLFPVTGRLEGYSDTQVMVRLKDLQFFIESKCVQPKVLSALKREKRTNAPVRIWAPSSSIGVRKILSSTTSQSVDEEDEDENLSRQPAATPVKPFIQWLFPH